MLQMWEFAAYPLLALMFVGILDRKSTRLNSSHLVISYAVFCLKKKNNDGFILIYDSLNLRPVGSTPTPALDAAPLPHGKSAHDRSHLEYTPHDAPQSSAATRQS